ncbi:hypothetical protein OQJ26_14315 [Legionella sp. PATHC038]|uniref:hypothetical protein n=1 Tax=Legionella sheltonii TaxID=2992041 RepID=UPI002243B7D0|nr:hypothetical protein [Legionella sp. PATHC038]MCW8399955.1 hypothetical protein [Legionella sp. PATHC038]
MPDLSRKFTDQKLKILYGHLLNHYQSCKERGLDINTMYAEMYYAVQFAIESDLSTSPLHLLENSEKVKAYHAFSTIFRALPLGISHHELRFFNPPMPPYNPKIEYKITTYNNYNSNDSALLNYLLIRSLIHDSHHHHGGSSCFGSSNHHGHDSKSNDDFTKLIFVLLVIALAAIAAGLAFIALTYMFYEFADSIDRFWYGEGWLKGALMFATSIGFGAGSAFLTLSVGALPLIALAVVTGFNPVGVVIMATVLLSIMGAGLGCFAMSLLYDSVNKSANKEAMDPKDPDRFRLTASEEEFLRDKKHLDPIAVKCAMIALRAEMEILVGKEKAIPSFFSRDNETQQLLTQLRKLRKGELSELDIGGLHFDCRFPIVNFVPTVYQPVQQTSSSYDAGIPEFPGYSPSAPAFNPQFM